MLPTADTIIKRHNIQVSGSGTQAIVFAHGLGCDQQIWRAITPAFEQDYKVVLFDYIGSGASDKTAYDSERYNTLNGYASDVLQLFRSLELERVIFVGHSVSSMIGLLAAIDAPELFQTLIMVGPSPCFVNGEGYPGGFYPEEIDALLALMKKNYKEWATFFAPRAMGNSDRPELSKSLQDRFYAADPTITLQFAEVVFGADLRSQLPSLQVPSLIMQIPEDILVPLSVGIYMSKAMPQSTLVRMNATGHFPHISAPQETIRVIKQYLAGGLA